jgi:hypothetical protein
MSISVKKGKVKCPDWRNGLANNIDENLCRHRDAHFWPKMFLDGEEISFKDSLMPARRGLVLFIRN